MRYFDVKKWLKYVKPYLVFFILAPFFMTVEVIGEVIMPRLLSIVINNANAGTLTTSTSLGIMVQMILTALAMMAGGVLGAFFATKAAVNFGADIRADAYAKVQNFSFANIDKFSTGSLVTRLTNDITQMQNFVNMLLRMAIRAPGMMIAALIMAVRIQPSLSMVFLVSIPLLLLTVGFLVKTGFPRFSIMQTKIDALNSTVQENVTNVRVVKSFVREKFGIEKFKKANGDLKDAAIHAVHVVILMQPVMTLFMQATIIAVLLLGGRIVLNGEMQVGDLSAFVTYVTQILWTLENAQEYMTGHHKLWIGQNYVTKDGKTKLYITIPHETVKTMKLGMAVNGTVSIDWGDKTFMCRCCPARTVQTF